MWNSEYETVALKLLQHILFLHDITTVVTLQQKRFLTLNIEFGSHRLVTVAYASWVYTLDNVLNGFWKLNPLFFHNLVTTNNVNRRVRSQQSNFVHFLRV
jgi:hypothetical protein